MGRLRAGQRPVQVIQVRAPDVNPGRGAARGERGGQVGGRADAGNPHLAAVTASAAGQLGGQARAAARPLEPQPQLARQAAGQAVLGAAGDDPRGQRGLLPTGALPGHARLAAGLERPVDWDAEFEADLADLQRLVEAVARRGA
jgi:hypothetical protein